MSILKTKDGRNAVGVAGVLCPRCIVGTDFSVDIFYKPGLCEDCKKGKKLAPATIIKKHKKRVAQQQLVHQLQALL